jgi:putative ubiquitin-RnfH superfamily antitoxin RatB of RatAB toxin-antitoxin module
MAAAIRVQVVYALPERAWSVSVQLPEGATVAEALAAADLAARVPGLAVDPDRLAIFGRAAGPASVLHDRDRVEILRPLQVDPKQARRQRARDAGKS